MTLSDSFQSLNVVESPQFQRLLLLLRPELKESDIPGRTTIRNHISRCLQEHLDQLKKEMKV